MWRRDGSRPIRTGRRNNPAVAPACRRAGPERQSARRGGSPAGSESPSGAALHHPDDIHRIGEYGRPGIDQAASRIVVSRVAPRQQRHADERNEDCDDDPHRTAFAEKERHDDGHHQRIEKIDGGGHAARYVIVRAQQSQRRGGVHQAQAGQHAEVAPRDAEVAFQQQRHRRHDGRREQHAVEENRRRGHARMKQRDREERDQPERGRRDNGVEHSLYITYVTHMFDVFSRWRLSWLHRVCTRCAPFRRRQMRNGGCGPEPAVHGGVAKRPAAPLRVFAAACAARHPERRQKPCSAVRDGKYSAVFGFYRTES